MVSVFCLFAFLADSGATCLRCGIKRRIWSPYIKKFKIIFDLFYVYPHKTTFISMLSSKLVVSMVNIQLLTDSIGAHLHNWNGIWMCLSWRRQNGGKIYVLNWISCVSSKYLNSRISSVRQCCLLSSHLANWGVSPKNTVGGILRFFLPSHY